MNRTHSTFLALALAGGTFTLAAQDAPKAAPATNAPAKTVTITAPAATIGYIQSVGLPLPQVGLAIALVVELLGGVALILGYRTRLVASVLAVFAIATRSIGLPR